MLITSGTINAAPLGANDTAIQLSATSTLNGIANGFDGREIDVYCATSGTLTVTHASGSAAATDQLFLSGGEDYGPITRGGIRFRYDGTNNVWREVARAALEDMSAGRILGRAIGAGTGQPQALSGGAVALIAGVGVPLEVHSAFAADASISITPPADATWFEYEIKAGGGGGGGADAETDGESCAGGGGGEGEEARGIFTIVSGNVTGSIGGGGAGGSNAGGTGTNGTQTVLTYNATSVTCAPGNGGVGVTVGPALAGQLAFSAGGPGGNSGASTANHNFYGGADGTNGVMFGNPTTVGLAAAAGGNGGNGGRGAIVNGAASAAAGTDGKKPGSGGGGGAVHTQTTGVQTGAAGGAGVAGFMTVRFYSGPVPTRSAIT